VHLRSLCGGPELGSVWVKVGHRGRRPRGTARYEISSMISSHGAFSCLTCAMMSATALSRPARFSRQDCYHVSQLSTRAPRRATGATRTARTVRVRTYMGQCKIRAFMYSEMFHSGALTAEQTDAIYTAGLGLKLKLVRGRSLPHAHDGLALTSQGLIWLDLT
jgi:hypothetical protein